MIVRDVNVDSSPVLLALQIYSPMFVSLGDAILNVESRPVTGESCHTSSAFDVETSVRSLWSHLTRADGQRDPQVNEHSTAASMSPGTVSVDSSSDSSLFGTLKATDSGAGNEKKQGSKVIADILKINKHIVHHRRCDCQFFIQCLQL